jgi:hypothetical protein
MVVKACADDEPHNHATSSRSRVNTCSAGWVSRRLATLIAAFAAPMRPATFVRDMLFSINQCQARSSRTLPSSGVPMGSE